MGEKFLTGLLFGVAAGIMAMIFAPRANKVFLTGMIIILASGMLAGLVTNMLEPGIVTVVVAALVIATNYIGFSQGPPGPYRPG